MWCLTDLVKRVLCMRSSSKIVSFYGAKGGVGKSIIAANFANILSLYGYKVLLIDLSLGLGNQDIIFNINNKTNLLGLLKDRLTLEETLIPIKENLYLITNESGDEIYNYHSNEIIEKLFSTTTIFDRFDYILLDMPSSISFDAQNFLKLSDEVVIISDPTPISLTNSYTNIKIASNYEKNIHLIFNKVSGSYESDLIFDKIENVISKNLKIKDRLNYLGSISNSKKIEKSTKNRTLFSDKYPNSNASYEIDKIIQNFIRKLEQKMLNSHRRKGFTASIRSLIEKI